MYILAPEVKKDLVKYCIKHNIALKFNKCWIDKYNQENG